MIGRRKERQVLQQKLDSDEAEFIAIYGRRRVGKTHLIREFFKDELCFELTGIHDADTKTQLRNFSIALAHTARSTLRPATPDSWQEAFQQLESVLSSSFGKKRSKSHRVLFLDELPWLDTHRSGFMGALGHFWNTWASRHRDVILVVCGSAAAWMIKKLLHDRGGLHNRVTCRIRLEAFTLAECEEFLRSRSVRLTRKQIVEIVMATGGIPHYLKEVGKGESAAQIIQALSFQRDGLLRDEFDRLYPSLFAHAENHLVVVRALSKRNRGLTRNEIARETRLPSGGGLTKVLDELEESGFIEAALKFGFDAKDRHYRLIDEYSYFYLRWIEANKRKSLSWENLQDSPKWRAWSGYAFESICRRHIPQIKAALGIAGVQTQQSTWTHRPRTADGAGAQIDLLIDRRDDCINLCEMKFSNAEFTIDKSYARHLRERRETFRAVTKTKKSLFNTFITTHGVRENAYSSELVQSELTIDALFSAT